MSLRVCDSLYLHFIFGLVLLFFFVLDFIFFKFPPRGFQPHFFTVIKKKQQKKYFNLFIFLLKTYFTVNHLNYIQNNDLHHVLDILFYVNSIVYSIQMICSKDHIQKQLVSFPCAMPFHVNFHVILNHLI